MRKKFFFIFFIISACFLSACVSRLARPAITGTILDYQNKPVAGFKIGEETVTDANGKFYLKEIRYSKFFIPEMFYMEAPPIHYQEELKKEGFLTYNIEGFNRYGGGRAKGAIDNLDTIYVKRINEILKPEDLIFTNWKFAANKSLDTLYGINKNFRENNWVTNNQNFVRKFDRDLDYKFNTKQKPDTAWSAEYYNLKTTYFVTLTPNGTYVGKKILNYKNAWKHRKEYENTYRQSYSIPDDSLKVMGKFKLLKDKIIFDEAFNHLKSNYKIDTIDRDVIILTRSKN